MAVTGPWARDREDRPPLPFLQGETAVRPSSFPYLIPTFACGPGAAVRTIIGYVSERLKRDRRRQARTNRGHRKIAAKVRLLRSRSQ
jgi:hypothetical protein